MSYNKNFLLLGSIRVLLVNKTNGQVLEFAPWPGERLYHPSCRRGFEAVTQTEEQVEEEQTRILKTYLNLLCESKRARRSWPTAINMGWKARDIWIHFVWTRVNKKFGSPRAHCNYPTKAEVKAIKNLPVHQLNCLKVQCLFGQKSELFISKSRPLYCLIATTLSRPKYKQLESLFAHALYATVTPSVFFEDKVWQEFFAILCGTRGVPSIVALDEGLLDTAYEPTMTKTVIMITQAKGASFVLMELQGY